MLTIAAKPGETVKLSAAGSIDLDGNAVTASWFVYPEAGTMRREVKLSETSGETTSLVVPGLDRRGPGMPAIHVILTVRDNGMPSLVSYRRAIIEIRP